MDVFEKFIDVVQHEAFIEAHEVLEDTWRAWKAEPALREESFILKGLINGATALALFRLGKTSGAHRVWSTYEKYRPRINTIPSLHTPFYKKAEALLDAKYQEIKC